MRVQRSATATHVSSTKEAHCEEDHPGRADRKFYPSSPALLGLRDSWMPT